LGLKKSLFQTVWQKKIRGPNGGKGQQVSETTPNNSQGKKNTPGSTNNTEDKVRTGEVVIEHWGRRDMGFGTGVMSG